MVFVGWIFFGGFQYQWCEDVYVVNDVVQVYVKYLILVVFGVFLDEVIGVYVGVVEQQIYFVECFDGCIGQCLYVFYF